MDDQFNVVYTGVKEGVTKDDFVEKFCKKFGVDKKKAQKIANSSSDVVIKKALNKKKATQYGAAFATCGMKVKMEKVGAAPANKPKPKEVKKMGASTLALEPIAGEPVSGEPESGKAKSGSAENIPSASSVPIENYSSCPKCDSDNIKDDECLSCGIVISKYVKNHTKEILAKKLAKQQNAVKKQKLASGEIPEKETNPYATPEASLEVSTVNTEGQGTLDGGLNGDYDFTIGEIYREAWEKTEGVKGKFLMAWGFYTGIAFALSGLFYFIPIDSSGIIESIVNVPILYPIMAGITLMGIHHSVGAEIEANSVFEHYGRVVPISLLSISMILLIMLGTVLLVVPGIYLGIAYMMALSLMMDRNMGIWESLETSRKAITKHWFQLFFIYVLLFLLVMVAMIPLFIGLIWVLPMSSVMQGILYKRIFGVESVA